MFGDEERAVDEDERENDLGHVLVQVSHHAVDRIAGHVSDQCTTETHEHHLQGERSQPGNREEVCRRSPVRDECEEAGEDDDTNAVVQQALALDDDGEAVRDPKLIEQCEHRNGICREYRCGEEKRHQ